MRFIGHSRDSPAERVSHDQLNVLIINFPKFSCKGVGITIEEGQNVVDALVVGFDFSHR